MMMMEAADHQDQEEAVLGYKDQAQMMIIKRKRTKRQRLTSPLSAIATTASSSSSAGHDHDHLQDQGLVGPRQRISTDVGPTASPATSSDQFTEISTEEEEDMANCLILLAQGNSAPKPQNPNLVNNNKAASAATSAGLFLYQCKTCDRCFPSFQALGGHRASHKKPGKQANIHSTIQDNKKALSFVEEVEEFDRFNNTSTTLSLQISNRAFRALNSDTTSPCYNNNKANKVHECSVCGAEFASGQALGGHMRRHRTLISTAATTAAATTAAAEAMSSHPQSQSGSKKPRNVLQLDLNLPAPEEEHLQETNRFPFGAKKEQVIVFSASPLVGCQY